MYDVYGRQGLAAGLELGPHLRSREELKAAWADFQARQQRQRDDALTAHRGVYMCRIDATAAVAAARAAAARLDYRGVLAEVRAGGGLAALRGADVWDRLRPPELRLVVVQNSLDAPASERDLFHLQGQAALRGQFGSGSVVGGYKRTLSPHDALEGSAVLGPKNVYSLSSHRQLTRYAQATLSGSWSAADGLGLQLSTSRHLFASSQGSLAWVVGPRSVGGLSLSLARRGKVVSATAKLDVGALTALMARLTFQLTPATSLRLTGRVGMLGVDVEGGLATRLSRVSSAYFGTVYGLQGTAVKARRVPPPPHRPLPLLLVCGLGRG